MSHVTTVDIDIKELAALKAACARRGLAFREGQTHYRWYGSHVGDYPVPEGFSKKDLGKCEHAIGVPNDGHSYEIYGHSYEIGVVRRRDGRPGWTLIYDFWGRGGRAIEALAGKKCAGLKQAYAIEAAKRSAKRQGFSVVEQMLPSGKCVLSCTR
jgi:hypothetical protein